MINRNELLDFDDLIVQPEIITNINSRSECEPYMSNTMLPIFTAPMDTVVNRNNASEFIKCGINVVMPRKERIGQMSFNPKWWYSYGLDEFRNIFLEQEMEVPYQLFPQTKVYALIDVANGHMSSVITTVREAKKLYGDNLVLMVGNIANPNTYLALSHAGADFVRVGIGNGGGCLTTEQTAVGYPMASLIDVCAQLKKTYTCNAKIVADGGMKKYADIIKALALGADYVMVGSILNKSLESAGENFMKFNEHYLPIATYHKMIDEGKIDKKEHYDAAGLMKFGLLYKDFRGMSTKAVQSKWGSKELKTSEGVEKYQKVEYTLAGWVDNFTAYLKTAMSYTGCSTLAEFTSGDVILNKVSQKSFNRYNK